MEDSILNSTKKKLGISADYDVFDIDIIDGINSALGTLNQLGIGPSIGFQIEDASKTWEDFLGDSPKLNPVKTYVALRVRLLFDPPQTGYLIEALNKEVEQLEWRMNVEREGREWVSPYPSVELVGRVIDGGDA